MSAPETPAAGAAATRSPLLSAGAQTYAAQLAVAVVSLGNALLVARVLGPTGRGEVAFLTAVGYLTSNLATLGVQEANVNVAGERPEARAALATNSAILAVILGLLTFGAVAGLVLLAPVVGGDVDRTLLWIVLATLPVLIFSTYLRFLIQGDYGFGITNLAWVLPAVINVGVNGALALFGVLSVASAVATWLAGQLIATALLTWHVRSRSVGFGRPSLSLLRSSLSFGLKSHVGRVMLLANYRIDQWMLGAIAGSRQLGLYSVAVAFAEALFLLPTALAAVQRPDLVRDDAASAAGRTSRLFRFSVLVTLVGALALIVLAPLLCVVVFGESFRGAVDDLRILSLGAFGIVALKQLGSALTARRKPTAASVAIGVAFVVMLLLDILLIPRHGGTGAAIASTVAYSIGGLVVAAMFVRKLGGRPRDLLPGTRDVREAFSGARRLTATTS